MRIVVLDGYTLNPGDLTWQKFEQLGDCRIYDRTAPHEILQRAAEAEAVLTNKTILWGPMLSTLPSLRYIGVLATGYNVVDLDVARERGITVTNVPAYATHSVAQMVFALILELTNRVGHHSLTVQAGKWSQCPDFCYWDFPIVELTGLTIGIIGFGNIGKKVAQLGREFGMRVLVHTRTLPAPEPGDVEFCSLDRIFRESDVVTLHCPLTKETEKMVNPSQVALMKPSAYLINKSRGPLVDEGAVASALYRGQLAGAGIDVLPEEPPKPDSPLLNAPNCYLTPHIAWASKASRIRLMESAFENLRAFLYGERRNVVTQKVLRLDSVLTCSIGFKRLLLQQRRRFGYRQRPPDFPRQ